MIIVILISIAILMMGIATNGMNWSNEDREEEFYDNSDTTK